MKNSLMPLNTSLSSFADFRNEMDRLFERFFHSEDSQESSPSRTWAPRLNLSESETSYEVSVDLPGIKPEEVEVELRHGDLWITGERQGESEEKGKTWHRIERYFGQFRRAVRLGDDVDSENVEAKFNDGVLHISIPKTAEARTRRIEIKS